MVKPRKRGIIRMVEFFIAMAIAGILGIIPIVLIDIYSNYKQNQITCRRKRWTMNAKRHNEALRQDV